ncbi:selenium cofactor biosynthesis protein YqeC [Clostridium sp.]|uniref:selenium cofactor biosynthesis protein YqeC n=1 Tax=Clostridium sp. TaxID=1506 RepID=UPI00302DE72E
MESEVRVITKLSEIIKIRKGEVISIAGAGGKTTLMFTLAKELRSRGNVLVTTTTKIYLPQHKDYDGLIIKDGLKNNSEVNKTILTTKLGIHVYGSSINEEGKLLGIDDRDLINEGLNYDYTLIEADGAKRKQVKGWNSNEPVISALTTITIGVLSGEALKLPANSSNVHRLKEFEELTLAKEGDIINEGNIISLIFNKSGLFKNSQGKKILFINKIDDNKLDGIEGLLKRIIDKNKECKLLDEIIIGSLLKKEYKSVTLGRNKVDKWNNYGLWT